MKKILATILAAALGLGAWAANAPTVTVSGTSVTISNESGAEGWDNATINSMTDYQGKNFTIPAIGTDLPSGTILKITSVSFAVSTSYKYMPDKLGLSGCTSAQKDTSGSFTGGAAATKSTYSFANTDCLVKVGTATPIRFLNSDGGEYSSYMSFRLGANAYQYIESIVWSGKAPIIEIQAEIVGGKVGVSESTGFETGSGSGKVYVSGYQNYLNTPGTNEKELVLVDGAYEYALRINNANSLQDNDGNGNRRTIFNKVSGSGTLTRTSHSNELNPVVEIYDSSEFTGTITTGGGNTTKMNVYFGVEGETFDDPRYLYNLLMGNNPASICVSADRKTANNNVVIVPEGKTWTASKLLNFGETVVNGTFAGDVVNSGILTINGTVTGAIVLDSATAQLVVASGATAPVPTTTVADSVIQTTTSGSSTVYTIGAGVPPVTFGVRSDNLFGSIKIAENVASNLYVATLFEGFEADGALRKAQDVVHATNLTAGTKMYVYDKNADKYDVFEVDANGKWAAALKINVTEMTNTFDTADLMRGVTNGTGVIVGRKNTAETVYVYGQVPKIPIASTTFGAGQTLVSPPYTNGVAYVDLNASKWTGVKATQLKRLKNQKGADYIQFRTADNRLVKYFYLEGEGWGVTPTQVSQCGELVANGKALIPVGTAFWYYSNAGGAKVEWK